MKITAAEVSKRLDHHIKLVEETYVNTRTKAKFIDENYGEFWTTPNNMFRRSKPYKPKIRTPFIPADSTISYLSDGSHVILSDNSRKIITNLTVGDEVFGVDRLGNVIPTKITKVCKGEYRDECLNIKGDRQGIGRGCHFWSILCTKNYRIWQPNIKKYIPAKDIKPNDEILIMRSEYDLTPCQKQVLVE